MEKSVKERIIEFCKINKISRAKFEKSCSFSNGYVNNLKHCPKPDKLELIFKNFPQLNPSWLLTGEGEMLRAHEAAGGSAIAENHPTDSADGDAGNKAAAPPGEVERLKIQIEGLQALVESLREIIAEKERTIQLLLKNNDSFAKKN